MRFIVTLMLLTACVPTQLLQVGVPPIPVPPQVLELINGEPPVSSSISDATFEAPQFDTLNPKSFTLLTEMPRTKDGGFYLVPGDYEFVAQSYCLHAGTFAPRVGGPGYSYAPLKGSRAKIVQRILQRSSQRPEIVQRDIQVLLWAVVARAKLSELPLSYQATAAKLLTVQELFELNGGAVGLLSKDLLKAAINGLPPIVGQVLEAENQLRGLLNQSNANFNELEQIAVRFGDPGVESLVRQIPVERWSRHPNGFLIRFLPFGYSSMRVQIHVPERPFVQATGRPSPSMPFGESWSQPQLVRRQFAASKTLQNALSTKLQQYNPSDGVGVPGNTGAQRLAPSGRPDKSKPTSIDQARSFTTGPGRKVPLVGAPRGSQLLGGGLAIPNYIFQRGLNWIYDTAEEISNALQGDPPRSDFTIIEQPKRAVVPSLQASGQITPEIATAANLAFDDSLEMLALLQAAAVTLDRLGGAQLADDAVWSELQSLHLITLKRDIGFAIRKAVMSLENMLDRLESAGVRDAIYSPADFAAFQADVRRDGFDADSIQAAKSLGLTVAELEVSKKRILDFDPKLAVGSVRAAFRERVRLLNLYASVWENMPEVPR
jgi:hypothetical protein